LQGNKSDRVVGWQGGRVVGYRSTGRVARYTGIPIGWPGIPIPAYRGMPR